MTSKEQPPEPKIGYYRPLNLDGVTVFDLFSEHPGDKPIWEPWETPAERRVKLTTNEFNQVVHSEKPTFFYRGTVVHMPDRESQVHVWKPPAHKPLAATERVSTLTYNSVEWRPYVPPDEPQPDHVVG